MHDQANTTTVMHDQETSPICTIDPYDYLKIAPNADGSITRLSEAPSTPLPAVLSKDVPLNPLLKTSLRIYLPRHVLESTKSSFTKLPLILYIHGGGFVFYSTATTLVHDFCFKMAAELDVVVVSVDYRLAPEHRLPAAYDDTVEAIHWIRDTKDPWLLDFADISGVYLMGTSAGANIAYHAGLRASTAAMNGDLEQLKIKGLILHHSFFGSSKRTASQLRLINNSMLPLSGADLMWELALPSDVDRDHEYCNPLLENESQSQQLEKIKSLKWSFFVLGCTGDPLIDHQRDLVKLLEKKDVHVVAIFSEGDYHGFELLELSKAGPLLVTIKKLMNHETYLATKVENGFKKVDSKVAGVIDCDNNAVLLRK